MMIAIQHFHFIRPYWLLALIPLLFLLWHLRYKTTSTESWKKVCDAHLLKAQLVGFNIRHRRWPLLLLALAWVIAVFALSGPAWKRLQQPVYRSLASRVIVLDLSPAMYATDIKPSRLARAKFKILDILKHSKEDQTALVVFSGEPFVVSPLTTDAATIANMVSVLTPAILPVSGSNVSWALKKAGELMQQAGVHKGSILLITANVGDNNAIKESTKLNKKGYKVSVLGIGTTQGAPIPVSSGGFLKNSQGDIDISKLNITKLTKLAAVGGGQYVSFTTNNRDINTLLNTSAMQHLAMKVKKSKATADIWQDEGRWFILLLLPLALVAFRRGYL